VWFSREIGGPDVSRGDYRKRKLVYCDHSWDLAGVGRLMAPLLPLQTHFTVPTPDGETRS
jgi:hypothetical protein